MTKTQKPVKKFVILIKDGSVGSNYDFSAETFNTLEEAQTFAQGGCRETTDYAEEVEEDEIFIAEIQTRYVNNPSFVRV